MYFVSRKIWSLASLAWRAPFEARLFINLEDVWKWVYTTRTKKKRTSREQTLALSRTSSSHFFFMFTSDIRSVEFAFIIYLKIGIHWTRTNSENASVYTHPENREVWRKNFFRSDDGTARVDGNWSKASTARKERRSSTSVSRNQVVARNLFVLSCRDFEEMYTSSKEDSLKFSAIDKREQDYLKADFAAFV